MIIKNISFSNCVLASGSMSFFGSGYWYHNLYQVLVPGFEITNELSFVTRTTALHLHDGNLALDGNYQPKDFFPSCIKALPFKGFVLDASDFSSPGARSLFESGNWQNVGRPFFISFSPLSATRIERLKETQAFKRVMETYLPEFSAPVGLQLNLFSQTRISEAPSLLSILSELSVPLDLKIGLQLRPEEILQIQDSQLCDILTVGSSLPYGAKEVSWRRLTGKKVSPLADFGGGSLSGKPLLPLVTTNIRYLRSIGVTLPIKASGGIMGANDVIECQKAGASAIEIATSVIIRPWRVKKIALTAEKIFS